MVAVKAGMGILMAALLLSVLRNADFPCELGSGSGNDSFNGSAVLVSFSLRTSEFDAYVDSLLEF